MTSVFDNLESARLEARRMVAGARFSDLPIDLASMASRLGVIEIRRRDIAQAGLLTANASGEYIIYHRSSDVEARVRFTVAHELGHILIARSCGIGVSESHRGGHSERVEEDAADDIAAELLMPAHLVRRSVEIDEASGILPSWRKVSELARRFGVSRAAMSRRFPEVPGLVAILVRANIPGEKDSLDLSYRCASSRSLQSFAFGRSREIRRLLRELTECSRNRRHIVPVRTKRYTIDLRCDGSIRIDSGYQYWVIGWAVED